MTINTAKRAVLYLLSANGAASILAWGNAPGLKLPSVSAEGAIQRFHRAIPGQDIEE